MPSLYFCVSCKQSIHIIDSFSVDYADFSFFSSSFITSFCGLFSSCLYTSSSVSVELRMPPPLVLCGGSPKKFAFLGADCGFPASMYQYEKMLFLKENELFAL